jgi:hypothetical protein
MDTIIEQIRVMSENGDSKYPCQLTAKMDGTKPGCPITLYSGGIPMFSLGEDEVDDFCNQLKSLAL